MSRCITVGALLAGALLFSLIGPSQVQATTKLAGRIVLQVEEHGEAWYIYPRDAKRYYLGRPADAFNIMRTLGLGIAHDELARYQASGFPTKLAGYIVLDVEMNGEAYYINPQNLRSYYLGRPLDAFTLMRTLGLGITNADLATIVPSDVDSGEPQPVVATGNVVDTNQTACYNHETTTTCPAFGEAFYGQDAQYQGVQPSYTDNGDGTVTDNVTGLMWVKEVGDKQTYEDAVAAADTATYAGYNDWRVPTITELYSLMDFSGQDIDPTSTAGGDPFINDNVFAFAYGDVSAGERIIDSQWVTSSVYRARVMNNEECFFGVNFADGRIKCYPTQRGKLYYARYVRGEVYDNNAFRDNNNGTVSDAASGLVWQQADSGRGMDWQAALHYCEELDLAGLTNWRLPNAKELQHIVDYSRTPDTTNSPAIDSVFHTSTIYNEAGAIDYPFFWTSTTHSNARGGNAAAYIAFGRALGYMNGQWMDVHGAGAQRSDPKTGSADDYPTGKGPQGDAIRVENHVRCVHE